MSTSLVREPTGARSPGRSLVAIAAAIVANVGLSLAYQIVYGVVAGTLVTMTRYDFGPDWYPVTLALVAVSTCSPAPHHPPTRGIHIMSAIKSCLWFHVDAEEAANFYVSLFPSSKVVNVMRAGDAVVAVEFLLDGHPFLALNGRREQGFTDAVSFVVPCASQDDVDHYWAALARGGEEGQCGWLKDRFGVSWQVVPNELATLLGDPDPSKAGRVMQAMLGMRKLDIAALRRARDGEAALTP